MKIQTFLGSLIIVFLPMIGMAQERVATIGLPGRTPQPASVDVLVMGKIDITKQECFPVNSLVESIQGTNKAHMAPRHTHRHQGIDFTPPASISDAEAMKLPIMAWKKGVVTSIGEGWGVVRITHHNGEKSVYGHLSSIRVKVGDTVMPCQHIGTMGNTHTYPVPIHLHFEVWRESVSLDPMKRLRQSPTIIVIGSTSKGFPILR